MKSSVIYKKQSQSYTISLGLYFFLSQYNLENWVPGNYNLGFIVVFNPNTMVCFEVADSFMLANL